MPRPRPLLAARSVLATLGVAALLLSGAAVATAAFRTTTGSSTSVGTTSVAPPTKFAATTACGKKAGTVVFTWTATGSTYADGYELRYTAGGTSRTVTIPHRSTTSTSFVRQQWRDLRVHPGVDVTLELDQHHEPDPAGHHLPVKGLSR